MLATTLINFNGTCIELSNSASPNSLSQIEVGMHGYHANYLLSGQIVAFFTICICICIQPETFLLSVSVSGQQTAKRYRYLKNKLFDK